MKHDSPWTPLPERVRPTNISGFAGSEALLASNQWLRAALQRRRLPSLLLFGPPGSGKTTLARLLANEVDAPFEQLHAVFDGVAELKKVLARVSRHDKAHSPSSRAQNRGGKSEQASFDALLQDQDCLPEKELTNHPLVLFIDEIHRYNRAQQDALLRAVESGEVVLIAATTENPAFALRSALLSRTQLLTLSPVSHDALATIIEDAARDCTNGAFQDLYQDRQDAPAVELSAEAIEAIVQQSDGDARRGLRLLERVADLVLARQTAESGNVPAIVGAEIVAAAIDDATIRHDRSGDAHYDVTSAFIKSMRASDVDAALYWMMRLIEAGDDPLFVLRRMIIFASEDIGNADPRALTLAMSADQAFQRLGMPEGLYALGQCCTYLATAPKSDAAQKAWKAAQSDVREHGSLPVPNHLRNAPTSVAKQLGHGKGYVDAHQDPQGAREKGGMPEALRGTRYYHPKLVGFEQRLRNR